MDLHLLHGAPLGDTIPAEDARLHPVRGAVSLGLEVVRAVLSTAERTVGEVQARLDR